MDVLAEGPRGHQACQSREVEEQGLGRSTVPYEYCLQQLKGNVLWRIVKNDRKQKEEAVDACTTQGSVRGKIREEP